MTQTYNIQCDCGAVRATLHGEPRVRGFCHCEDCRELLQVPYHSVNAYEKDFVSIDQGQENLVAYQHPSKRMQRVYCKHCGETLFNTNAADWRVVSQLLVRKNYGGDLPEALQSKMHFFYGRRIIDVQDDLPKRD